MHQNYKDFLSSINVSVNAQLMAIDYGEKKLGLAVASLKVKLPVPLMVHHRKSTAYDKEVLAKVVRDYQIAGLVVGISLQGNDAVEKQKLKIEKYLKEVGLDSMPRIWIDESYTTKMADDQMKDIGLNRKKRNQIDDKIAATILLQDFFRLI